MYRIWGTAHIHFPERVAFSEYAGIAEDKYGLHGLNFMFVFLSLSHL